MKIDICIFDSFEKRFIKLQVRVPKNIEVISLSTVEEILDERRERVKVLNKYYKDSRASLSDNYYSVVYYDKFESGWERHKHILISWSPVIDRDILEVIQELYRKS